MLLHNKHTFAKTVFTPVICFFTILAFTTTSCDHSEKLISSSFVYLPPLYDSLSIECTNDTISFPLDANTYAAIKSLNYFEDDGTGYLSFYDKRSESLNIFHLDDRKLVKRFELKKILNKRTLSNTTVYVKSLDSILINDDQAFYLFTVRSLPDLKIKFQTKPFKARAAFDNTTPPVILGNILITKARVYLEETLLSDLKNWKTVYTFDLKSKETDICYQLPRIYRETVFGYRFFDYSYCYTSSEEFLFSFPVDDTIYLTNLQTKNVGFFARSKSDTSLTSVKTDLHTDETIQKSYLLQHTYGAIYYDPHNMLYLRVSKQKLSQKEYEQKVRKKRQSLIILNSQLQIIGESPIDGEVMLSTIFFTRDGKIYARTNAADQNAIHFVRLKYTHGNQKS